MEQTSGKIQKAEASEVSQLTDHLFRHEAAKLISVLTGLFGTERLQLAEDVVQEALVRALQTWPYYGVPKNPAAWLTQTAKNFTLDLLRREKSFRDKQPQIISALEHWPKADEVGVSESFDSGIEDDRLRLFFTCCHPAIPQEAQIALALKTLCAFNAQEIASAFLTSEAAIEKRLVRARQRIRELKIPFEIPEPKDLEERLKSVLHTLYLLFNEGYKATSGESLIRKELCDEAIRLTSLVAQHPAGNKPSTHALLALMLFNAARLPGRTDAEGNILRLKEQDRSLWNSSMIHRGMRHLAQSASGEEASSYHFQAGIAACHSLAKHYQATDWRQILSLYDRLIAIEPSAIVALNRAVALAEVEGPESGIAAVEGIQKAGELKGYYLLHAVLGEFEAKRRNFSAAAGEFREAIKHTQLKSEQALLRKRLSDCETAGQK